MGTYWPSAPTAMSYIAGATTSIHVNSCLIVLPYHNPILLAKTVSTLDVMSGGRVMLTFGVGHAENEFKSLGVPFHRRGRITDEYVEVMVALWTEDAPSYQGEFVQFDGIRFEPKPLQRPHPPIWFGGNSSAALRRVARYGTGWMPWLVTPEELPARLDELEQMPGYGAHGRVDVWFPPVAHQDPGGQPRPDRRRAGRPLFERSGGDRCHRVAKGHGRDLDRHPVSRPRRDVAVGISRPAGVGAETVMPLFR